MNIHNTLGRSIAKICGGDHTDYPNSYVQKHLGEKRVTGHKHTVSAKRKSSTKFEIELGLQKEIVDDRLCVVCVYVFVICDITQQQLVERALRHLL